MLRCVRHVPKRRLLNSAYSEKIMTRLLLGAAVCPPSIEAVAADLATYQII